MEPPAAVAQPGGPRTLPDALLALGGPPSSFFPSRCDQPGSSRPPQSPAPQGPVPFVPSVPGVEAPSCNAVSASVVPRGLARPPLPI